MSVPVIVALDGVVTAVNSQAVVNGVTLVEAVEGAPVPMAFVAVTVKV
jgi:hypothetical protein